MSKDAQQKGYLFYPDGSSIPIKGGDGQTRNLVDGCFLWHQIDSEYSPWLRVTPKGDYYISPACDFVQEKDVPKHIRAARLLYP